MKMLLIFLLMILTGCNPQSPEEPDGQEELIGDFAPVQVGNTWVYSSRSVSDMHGRMGSWNINDSLNLILSVIDSTIRSDSIIYTISLRENGRRITASLMPPTLLLEIDTSIIDTVSIFTSTYTNGKFFDSLVYLNNPIPFFSQHTVNEHKTFLSEGNSYYKSINSINRFASYTGSQYCTYRAGFGLFHFSLNIGMGYHDYSVKLTLRSFNDIPIVP